MESKPFASLSSSLLARKGQASPAMRRQAFGVVTPHEDLGWNDMGHGLSHPVMSYPVTPEIDVHAAEAPAAVPEVRRQQAEIAEELGAVAEAEAAFPAPPAEPAPAPAAPVVARIIPISRALGGAKAKSAFTLRLDPARHLRLRLACAITRRSAQAIVTDALDQILNDMPQVHEIAGGMIAADRGFK